MNRRSPPRTKTLVFRGVAHELTFATTNENSYFQERSAKIGELPDVMRVNNGYTAIILLSPMICLIAYKDEFKYQAGANIRTNIHRDKRKRDRWRRCKDNQATRGTPPGQSSPEVRQTPPIDSLLMRMIHLSLDASKRFRPPVPC